MLGVVYGPLVEGVEYGWRVLGVVYGPLVEGVEEG